MTNWDDMRSLEGMSRTIAEEIEERWGDNREQRAAVLTCYIHATFSAMWAVRMEGATKEDFRKLMKNLLDDWIDDIDESIPRAESPS